jgi:hypothetical protein
MRVKENCKELDSEGKTSGRGVSKYEGQGINLRNLLLNKCS